MFNLSGSEIVFLLVAGLVVLGPERLPGAVRSVARMYADLRKAAQGVERDLREAFAEPLEEVRGITRDLQGELEGARDLFGKVDDEPSPPMRPEKARGPGDEPSDGATVEGDR